MTKEPARHGDKGRPKNVTVLGGHNREKGKPAIISQHDAPEPKGIETKTQRPEPKSEGE
jgi:hypothetical protein